MNISLKLPTILIQTGVSVLSFALSVFTPFVQAETSKGSTTILARGPSGATVSSNDILAELKFSAKTDRKTFFSRPDGVEELAESLLTRRSLASEAVRDGLDKDPLIAAAIDISRDRVLSIARLTRIDAQNTPNESVVNKQAREAYDANPVQYSKPARTRARHILIENIGPESLVKARSYLAELRSGASFETMAKNHSTDISTAVRGGDLGFFSPSQVVEPFAVALSALEKPGDLSEPVLSQFGYHIIRLEERRDEGIPPFDEVREQLMSEIRTNMLKEGRLKTVENLKQNFTVDHSAVEEFKQAEKAK